MSGVLFCHGKYTKQQEKLYFPKCLFLIEQIETVYEALSGWSYGKVFLDIIFKIQENFIIMICNTRDVIYIV